MFGIIIFLIKLFAISYLIKLAMTWGYNIIFFMMKKPYLYIIFSFLFNIIIFQILLYFYSQETDTSIINIYALSSIIALMMLIPPKSKVYSQKEMDNFADELTGVQNSIRLNKIALFAFFIGGVIGSYLIMYQANISVLDTFIISHANN